MNFIKSRPWLMHGLLGGLVLFSVKLVLCFSGHWTLDWRVLTPFYPSL